MASNNTDDTEEIDRSILGVRGTLTRILQDRTYAYNFYRFGKILLQAAAEFIRVHLALTVILLLIGYVIDFFKLIEPVPEKNLDKKA